MRVFDLAWKDLLEIGRDWKSAMFLLIMPILFTLFFGVILGPAFEANGGNDRPVVAILDRDSSGDLGARLATLLAQSDAIETEILESGHEQVVADMVDEGDLAAVVSVPPMFSVDALSGGEMPSVAVIADRSTQAGQTAAAIETAGARLASAVEVAQISADLFEERRELGGPAERQAFLSEATRLAANGWREPPITVMRTPAGPVNNGEPALESGFVQSSPGMMVQFAIFGLITAAMVLVLERKSGALRRLLTTPISRAEVIAGHTLAMFAIIVVQQVVLVLAGQWFFDVDYLRAPWVILLMIGALALWAASLGLLIGAFAKSEEQVVTLSLIAMFVFAALGGAWFPLEVAGETFATIGHVMPTAWAMDGLQNVVVRGLGFGSVLLPAVVLLAYTALFFGLAVWRFEFE